MQISEVFAALKRRWYATVLVVIVAVGAAIAVNKSMATTPKGSATLQILVDSPVSSLVNLQANPTGLETRASVLAQAMASNVVVASIAKTAGVPAREVTAQGPYSGAGQALNVATPSEARGTQIVSQNAPFRLTFVAQQQIPIVTVSVDGPTPQAAGRLANAILPGTNAWLESLATAQQVKSGRLVHLRQLGDAQTGPVGGGSKMIAAAGAVAVLILGLLAIVLIDGEAVRARRKRLDPSDHEGAFGHELELDRVRAAGHARPDRDHGSPAERPTPLATGRVRAVAVARVRSPRSQSVDEGARSDADWRSPAGRRSRLAADGLSASNDASAPAD